MIPLNELKEITNNFGRNVHVGDGSYGKVYYGILKNGKDAAIRKPYECAQSNEAFWTQVGFNLDEEQTLTTNVSFV